MATKPADSLSIDMELSDMELDLELTPLAKERNRPITRKYRNLTDKGRAYQIEIKEQHCKSIQKRISIMSKTIESIMNDDPDFSRHALGRIGQEDKGKSKGTISKFSNNAIVTEEKLPHPCIVCNASHDLDECKEYLKKSLAERRALITMKGLL